MDFTTTLITFGTILSLVALIGAAFSFLLAGASDEKKRLARRRLVTSSTIAILLIILSVQYFVSPQTSLITLIPGVPFPYSTLHDCHVTIAKLPPATPLGNAIPTQVAPNIQDQPLAIRGSTALGSLFQDATKAFDATYQTQSTVILSTSQDGFESVNNKKADIGLSDIFLQDAPDLNARDYPLIDYQVGVVVFTLLVSPDLRDSVQNITTDQLIAIYSGQMKNWRNVGGPDEKITVIGREVGSGTQVGFEKYALFSKPKESNPTIAGSTNEMLNLLNRTNGAIGYVATTVLAQNPASKASPICLNGYGATPENINEGLYSYWNYEHAYVLTPPQADPPDAVSVFLNYVCSVDFQSHDLLSAGFLRIQDLSATAIDDHARGYPPPKPCISQA